MLCFSCKIKGSKKTVWLHFQFIHTIKICDIDLQNREHIIYLCMHTWMDISMKNILKLHHDVDQECNINL